MGDIKINGDVQTQAYYTGGSTIKYSLIAKIRKTIVSASNEIRITFRLMEFSDNNYYKSDYYIALHSGSVSFVKLEKEPNLICHLKEDSNCLYVYAESKTNTYPIIMQILGADKYSLSHIELTHMQEFTETMLLGDTENLATYSNYISKLPLDGFKTSRTTGTAGKYARIARLTMSAITKGLALSFSLTENGNNNSSMIGGTIYIKTRRQTTDVNPTANIKGVAYTTDFAFANVNVMAVVVDLSNVDIFIHIKTTYTEYSWKPIVWNYTDTATSVQYFDSETLLDALPTGTVVNLFTS